MLIRSQSYLRRFLDQATGLYTHNKTTFEMPVAIDGRHQMDDDAVNQPPALSNVGGRPAPPTQGAQGMALGLGMAPNAATATAVARGLQALAAKAGEKINAGLFSAEWVLKGLSRGAALAGAPSTAEVAQKGHDQAFAMTTTSEHPSYGFMLANNATTIWEVWGYSDSTYSHNHPMFSGVVTWLINIIAGVEVAADAIGGDRLLFAPLPPSGGRLAWARGAIRTPLGRAASSWRCDGSGGMAVNISVPADTTAQVVLPTNQTSGTDKGDGWFRANVSSGNYTYTTITPLCDNSTAPPTPSPQLCGELSENLQDPPKLLLGCAPASNETITFVTFASFGTPAGDCTSGFKVDPKCNSATSMGIVQNMCLGKASCAVPVDLHLFGNVCDGVVKRLAASVQCGHPTTMLCGKMDEDLKAPPKLLLSCAANQTITKVTFASFGTPTGDCTSGFKVDPKCNSANSTKIVEGLCLGRASCSVPVSIWTFGNVCDDVAKWLAASVQCS
jgi:hypothetical protein